MTLPASVANIEDLDEHDQKHYIKRGEKWHLETEGDEAKLRLQNDLRSERDKLRAAQERLKAFETHGVTKPEDIESLRARRKQEDTEDETAAARTKRVQGELDEERRGRAAEVAAEKARADRFALEIMQLRIGSQIRAVAHAKLLPWAIEDAVLNGMQTFRDDGTGKFVAFDANNERLLGKNGEDLTTDEWLDGMRQGRPGWFPVSASGTGNQGGGAQHQGGTPPATRVRPKTRGQMSPDEKAAAISELGRIGYMQIPE